MFLNGMCWIVYLLSRVCKSWLCCPHRFCKTWVHGCHIRLFPLSSFQSHPQFSKSVLCSEAKRSFVTVWPGSPWMKTSNQALIVTNYIRLYLCNLHCSNLIQTVLRLWKPGKAEEITSTCREMCGGDLIFPTGSIPLHIPVSTTSILSSQSCHPVLPKIFDKLSSLVPLHLQCLLKVRRRKNIWPVIQKNVKMRCKKEEHGGIGYCCPTIPHLYMEGSLDLQMLLSIPRCDSEGKKKKKGEKY